jgi:hypothetical protein
MIEHSHLKIIQALQLNGTLTEAANALKSKIFNILNYVL